MPSDKKSRQARKRSANDVDKGSGSGKKRPPFLLLPVVHTSSAGPSLHFTEEEKEYMSHFGKRECTRLNKMLHEMRPDREPRRLRVLRSNLPMHVKAEVFQTLACNETSKYESWVETALRLPIGKYTPPPASMHADFLMNARLQMDAEITGHEHAKQEVMRLICGWLSSGAQAGFALGLEGEAGVGKTSFVKRALSKCMQRPFCFISLGGASDAAGLLGHSYTYEGAMQGRVAECLIHSETMDPILFFDELDKISTTSKGEELVHALIHLTDPVQNSHFRDRFLHGIDLDLSRAVIVFSYNDAGRVNPILLDRLKRIRMGTPSHVQRVEICESHLIPRAAAIYPNVDIEFGRDVTEYIVKKNENEPGMRSIERDIAHVISSYCLVRTCQTGSVLGLPNTESRALDLDFASALLTDSSPSTSPSTHLLMYT